MIMDVCAQDGCSAPKSGKSKYCKTHKAEARKRWKEMVANKGDEKEARDKKWADLYDRAEEAGREAAEAAVPVPMVVSGYEHDPVMDGVCGFGWVVVHPGNCSCALWAKQNKGARAEYPRGMCVRYVGEYNQSMTRKEAFANAFAEVLQGEGIKAYGRSRMD
jgi:hypothetical protein